MALMMILPVRISLRQAWRSSAIIALPSRHARTVAIGSKVQHSISAFAFYTGSGAACVLCPTFVTQQFTPALKNALKQRGIARPLYDDINLHALINLCARRLQKPFENRDVQFLRLFLQYCLLQHHAGITPVFNPVQQILGAVVCGISACPGNWRHWQRHVMQAAPLNEALFMALLFSMIRLPDPIRDTHQRAQKLRLEVARLGAAFSRKRERTLQRRTRA
nr:stationary phase inducible protein CsiE [Salmonella sp. NCTC 7297]